MFKTILRCILIAPIIIPCAWLVGVPFIWLIGDKSFSPLEFAKWAFLFSTVGMGRANEWMWCNEVS